MRDKHAGRFKALLIWVVQVGNSHSGRKRLPHLPHLPRQESESSEESRRPDRGHSRPPSSTGSAMSCCSAWKRNTSPVPVLTVLKHHFRSLLCHSARSSSLFDLKSSWKCNKITSAWIKQTNKQTDISIKGRKYIYSSTVPKYKFEVLVLYLSIFFSCHFLLLHYIYLTASQMNIFHKQNI